MKPIILMSAIILSTGCTTTLSASVPVPLEQLGSRFAQTWRGLVAPEEPAQVEKVEKTDKVEKAEKAKSPRATPAPSRAAPPAVAKANPPARPVAPPVPPRQLSATPVVHASPVRAPEPPPQVSQPEPAAVASVAEPPAPAIALAVAEPQELDVRIITAAEAARRGYSAERIDAARPIRAPRRKDDHRAWALNGGKAIAARLSKFGEVLIAVHRMPGPLEDVAAQELAAQLAAATEVAGGRGRLLIIAILGDRSDQTGRRVRLVLPAANS